jgi:outer membrane immunogenic protein
MRKKAIAMAGLALLPAASAARAADIPGVARPYAAPAAVYAAYNWMGPYIGANVGLQWGNITRNPTVGGETDIQWSNADDVIAPWKFANPWFGTARARVGYAWNNVLLYGTGGFAYGGIELDSRGLEQNRTHYGWTLGAGAEIGLTPNWTAKVEYLYFDLANRPYFIGTANGLESNLVRVGVNYKF